MFFYAWGAPRFVFVVAGSVIVDFSGYTDMALGIARMLGFRLPENFNSPYVSGSITEFWRRWHMTLSAWFRDYVFLPLDYSVSRKLPKERYIGLKADNIGYFARYIHKMFSFTSGTSDIWINSKFWTMIGIAAFFSFWGFFKKIEKWHEKLYINPGNRTVILFSILALLLFILSEAAITSTGFSPFIYFRF